MSQPRVLLGLLNSTDHEIEELAGHVIAGLYQSQFYTTPPPPFVYEMLQQQLTTFTTACAAVKDGGPLAIAARDQARQVLVGSLRQLAAYVTTVMLAHPDYGLAELLASGFDAVSSNRARHTLVQPTIRKIDNTGEGQLTLRVDAVKNAKQYEVRYQTMPGGDWSNGHLFDSTRGMIVQGLTPGALYTFQVRALGGATGGSDWSDAVSHRSL